MPKIKYKDLARALRQDLGQDVANIDDVSLVQAWITDNPQYKDDVIFDGQVGRIAKRTGNLLEDLKTAEPLPRTAVAPQRGRSGLETPMLPPFTGGFVGGEMAAPQRPAEDIEFLPTTFSNTLEGQRILDFTKGKKDVEPIRDYFTSVAQEGAVGSESKLAKTSALRNALDVNLRFAEEQYNDLYPDAPLSWSDFMAKSSDPQLQQDREILGQELTSLFGKMKYYEAMGDEQSYNQAKQSADEIANQYDLLFGEFEQVLQVASPLLEQVNQYGQELNQLNEEANKEAQDIEETNFFGKAALSLSRFGAGLGYVAADLFSTLGATGIGDKMKSSLMDSQISTKDPRMAAFKAPYDSKKGGFTGGVGNAIGFVFEQGLNMIPAIAAFSTPYGRVAQTALATIGTTATTYDEYANEIDRAAIETGAKIDPQTRAALAGVASLKTGLIENVIPINRFVKLGMAKSFADNAVKALASGKGLEVAIRGAYQASKAFAAAQGVEITEEIIDQVAQEAINESVRNQMAGLEQSEQFAPRPAELSDYKDIVVNTAIAVTPLAGVGFISNGARFKEDLYHHVGRKGDLDAVMDLFEENKDKFKGESYKKNTDRLKKVANVYESIPREFDDINARKVADNMLEIDRLDGQINNRTSPSQRETIEKKITRLQGEIDQIYKEEQARVETPTATQVAPVETTQEIELQIPESDQNVLNVISARIDPILNPLTQRMTNAEEIDMVEIEAVAEQMIDEQARILESETLSEEEKQSLSQLIELQIDNILSYEFATITTTEQAGEKTKTAGLVATPREGRPLPESVVSRDRFDGAGVRVAGRGAGRITVKRIPGFGGRSVYGVSFGNRKGVTPVEDLEFDNLEFVAPEVLGDGSLNVRVRDSKSGLEFTITDPELSMDLAIAAQLKEAGRKEFPQPAFLQAVREVTQGQPTQVTTFPNLGRTGTTPAAVGVEPQTEQDVRQETDAPQEGRAQGENAAPFPQEEGRQEGQVTPPDVAQEGETPPAAKRTRKTEQQKADEGKAILDKLKETLRALKAKPGGGANIDLTFGVAPISKAVWNAAIDTAILAIDAGQSIAQAVKAASDYISSKIDGDWGKAKFEQYMDERFGQAPLNQQIDDVAESAGISPKNFRDLYRVNRELFGLNQSEAMSAAIAMDKMIDVMAKRAGVSKTEMYGRLNFKKATEQDLPQGAIKQDKEEILRVFHGTSKDKDFKKFKDTGKGVFVTISPKDASEYAEQNDSMKFGDYDPVTRKFREINTASRVIPMNLKLGNSYKLTKADLEFLNSKPNYSALQKELHARIKANGFDTIDYGNGVYAVLTEGRLRSMLTNEVLFQKDLPQGVKFQVDAWHGSPYQFDKFTTDRIGTGEGAQAFGWGLYFTDLESIAETYAKNLSKRRYSKFLFNGKPVSDSIGNILDYFDYTGFDVNLKNIKQSLIDFITEEIQEDKTLAFLPSQEQRYRDEIDFIRKANVTENKSKGVVYKASINKGKTSDQETWIEWDKPISPEVKKKILDFIERDKKYGGNVAEGFVNTWKEAKRSIKYRLENNLYSDGQSLYEDIAETSGLSPKSASLFLLDAGIAGNKYPAESIARGATSDTARGFNYVVFDENAVSIEEVIKFQEDAVKARGAMMITLDGQATIYALTDPNVSTPLHELAHVFEHYLTDGEKATVQEWAKTEDWTIKTSEAFARGFEKYLAEGKAPTAALQKIFDNFKQWLTDIYRGIVGSDIDIELNKPMRDLYAKMLGDQDSKEPTVSSLKNKVSSLEDRLNDEENNGYERIVSLQKSIYDKFRKDVTQELNNINALSESIGQDDAGILKAYTRNLEQAVGTITSPRDSAIKPSGQRQKEDTDNLTIDELKNKVSSLEGEISYTTNRNNRIFDSLRSDFYGRAEKALKLDLDDLSVFSGSLPQDAGKALNGYIENIKKSINAIKTDSSPSETQQQAQPEVSEQGKGKSAEEIFNSSEIFEGQTPNQARLFFADALNDFKVPYLLGQPALDPRSDMTLTLNGAKFLLSENQRGPSNYVLIDDFLVNESLLGTGKGRDALVKLIEYADKNGITLVGEPLAMDGRRKSSRKGVGLSQKDLTDFYKRYGFTKISKESLSNVATAETGFFERKPQQQAQPEAKPAKTIAEQRKEFRETAKKYFDGLKKMGIAFDPERNSKEDIAFLKALAKYIKLELDAGMVTFNGFLEKTANLIEGFDEKAVVAAAKEAWAKEVVKAYPKVYSKLQKAKKTLLDKELQDARATLQDSLMKLLSDQRIFKQISSLTTERKLDKSSSDILIGIREEIEALGGVKKLSDEQLLSYNEIAAQTYKDGRINQGQLIESLAAQKAADEKAAKSAITNQNERSVVEFKDANEAREFLSQNRGNNSNQVSINNGEIIVDSVEEFDILSSMFNNRTTFGGTTTAPNPNNVKRGKRNFYRTTVGGGLIYLLDKLKGKTPSQETIEFFNRLQDQVKAGTFRKKRLNAELNKNRGNAINRFFGNRFVYTRRMLSTPMINGEKLVIKDQNGKEITKLNVNNVLFFYQLMKDPHFLKKDGKGERKIGLSEQSMRDIVDFVNLKENDDIRELMNNDQTLIKRAAQTAAQVMEENNISSELLNPRTLNLSEYKNDDFIGEILNRIYNNSVPSEIEYFPSSVESEMNNQVPDVDALLDEGLGVNAVSAMSRFMIERVSGGKVKVKSYDAQLSEYFDSMSNTAAKLPILKRFQAVFNKENSDLISSYFGKNTTEELRENIGRYITSRQQDVGLGGWLIKKTSEGALGKWLNLGLGLQMFFNFASAFSQLASFPGPILSYGITNYLDGLSMLISGKADLRDSFASLKSGLLLQERLGSRIDAAAIVKSIPSDERGFYAYVNQFNKALISLGAAPSAYFDAASIMLSLPIYVREYENARKTMTEKDAKDYAEEKTMDLAESFLQTKNEEMMSSAESRYRTTLYSFATIVPQLHRQAIMAVKRIQRGEGDLVQNMNVFIWSAIGSSVAFRLLRPLFESLFEGDDEDEELKKLRGDKRVRRVALDLAVDATKSFGFYGAIGSAILKTAYQLVEAEQDASKVRMALDITPELIESLPSVSIKLRNISDAMKSYYDDENLKGTTQGIQALTGLPTERSRMLAVQMSDGFLSDSFTMMERVTRLSGFISENKSREKLFQKAISTDPLLREKLSPTEIQKFESKQKSEYKSATSVIARQYSDATTESERDAAIARLISLQAGATKYDKAEELVRQIQDDFDKKVYENALPKEFLEIKKMPSTKRVNFVANEFNAIKNEQEAMDYLETLSTFDIISENEKSEIVDILLKSNKKK